jgi:hypothetical protein
MACKDDSSWPNAGTATKDECVTWNELITLRKKYNQVVDELDKYNIKLMLANGRAKYGDSSHNEEIEPLATVNGFMSIKIDTSGNFEETRFIITGGTINDRIPSNADYDYNHSDYGDWIVYIKSDCYGCGGWKLEEGGDHYPRYRCCGGNASTCGDMDSSSWKSQNYVGRSVDSGICNFGREWASNYMDVMNACISACPKTMCVCDTWPNCGQEVSECCNINLKYHWSNHFDFLGPVGIGYGSPNCNVDATLCPQNHEKRGIKWIGSHEPSSGYTGYVTQVIKARHLTDIWAAIEPAFGGGNRTGDDWNYCSGDDKVWKKDNNITLSHLQLRDCEKCCRPGSGEPICACQVNDLMHVLTKMLNMTCTCDGKTSADQWKGKTMFKIGHPDTPTVKDCPCFELCCKDMDGGPYAETESVSLDNRTPTFSSCNQSGSPCGDAESGSCGGATQTTYIESTKEWPDCFKDFEPRARVSGAADNWGDIAGAQSTNQNTDSCILGYLSPTYVDVETFAGSANKFKMKVKATSVNAAHGGPHGWQATAQFGFKLPIPDPCTNFTSLADEPCGGGDGGGPPPPPPYTSMNFFPIGPGNTMAFV